jgi:hypothetical protein
MNLTFPRVALASVLLATLSACTTLPATTPLVVGEQASLEGEVVRVDTAPWSYDGNAVVTVSTPTHGAVNVQLPARWNRCKAQPLGDVQGLQAHDHVQVIGTVTAPGELLVCAQPEHRLQKVE